MLEIVKTSDNNNNNILIYACRYKNKNLANKILDSYLEYIDINQINNLNKNAILYSC